MIKIGSAGSSGLGNLKGVEHCKKLCIHAMEVEFTHGVNMKNELAKKVGEKARELGIDLSIHAPYYINLNAKEPEKIEASKKRILNSCERAHHLGATHVVFHPAYYMKGDPMEVYEKVKQSITEMQAVIRQNKWNVQLAPETTGKPTQFGSLQENLQLVKETGCSICVDFAHIYARKIGKINYNEVFDQIEKSSIKHLHSHFSGIVHGPKGERHHVPLTRKFMLPLAEQIVKRNTDITIICECPEPFKDVLVMKKIFEELGW